MKKPRHSYVDPGEVRGTPPCRNSRPLPPRGHAPPGEPGDPRARAGSVLVVRRHWRDVFHQGVADHSIKLCRIYVSRSVLCEFCGNQRWIKAAKAGIVEDDYRDLDRFRELDPLRRQAEGRPVLRRGDHLGSAR